MIISMTEHEPAKPNSISSAPSSAGQPEQPHPRCLDRGYSLHGLAENRCPVCGRPFDPNDSKSWRTARILTAKNRWLIRATGRIFLTLLIFDCLLLMYSFTPPSGYSGSICLGLFMGFPILLWWLCRVTIGLSVSAYYRIWELDSGRIRGWITPPLVIILTSILLYFNVPFRNVFHLSRPSLERFARQILQDKIAIPHLKTIGIYTIRDAKKLDNGLILPLGETGFWDKTGLAYFPDLPPTSTYDEQFTLLEDGWYV